jgi:hypothetical protein
MSSANPSLGSLGDQAVDRISPTHADHAFERVCVSSRNPDRYPVRKRRRRLDRTHNSQTRSCSRSESPNRLIVTTTFTREAAKQAARMFRWCVDQLNPPPFMRQAQPNAGL